MTKTLSAAWVIANILLDHEVATIDNLKAVKYTLESEFDVYVDISRQSLGEAMFYYSALFELRDGEYTRNPTGDEYFTGTYVHDWFNSDVSPEIVKRIRGLKGVRRHE